MGKERTKRTDIITRDDVGTNTFNSIKRGIGAYPKGNLKITGIKKDFLDGLTDEDILSMRNIGEGRLKQIRKAISE